MDLSVQGREMEAVNMSQGTANDQLIEGVIDHEDAVFLVSESKVVKHFDLGSSVVRSVVHPDFGACTIVIDNLGKSCIIKH